MKPTIVVMLAALLMSCATSPPNIGVSREPNAPTIAASGQGQSRDEARDRARANLAKLFEVTIPIESPDVQAFRRSAAGGEYAGIGARRIIARSERLLGAIEMSEASRDPDGTYRATTFVSRAKAVDILRNDIERMDEITRKQLARAQDAQDLLIRIGALLRAVTLQMERSALEKSLQSIEPGGRGVAAPWNVGQLQTDLDTLLKRFKVAPPASNPMDRTAPVVKNGLAAAGVMADMSVTGYVLQGELVLSAGTAFPESYTQRATFHVRLTDAATKRERGAQRWFIQASGSTKEQAMERLLVEAGETLKKDLRATLIGMAGAAD